RRAVSAESRTIRRSVGASRLDMPTRLPFVWDFGRCRPGPGTEHGGVPLQRPSPRGEILMHADAAKPGIRQRQRDRAVPIADDGDLLTGRTGGERALYEKLVRGVPGLQIRRLDIREAAQRGEREVHVLQRTSAAD